MCSFRSPKPSRDQFQVSLTFVFVIIKHTQAPIVIDKIWTRNSGNKIQTLKAERGDTIRQGGHDLNTGNTFLTVCSGKKNSQSCYYITTADIFYLVYYCTNKLKVKSQALNYLLEGLIDRGHIKKLYI